MSHAKRRLKYALSGLAILILMSSIIARTLIAYRDRPLLPQAIDVMSVRDHSFHSVQTDYPSFWTSPHTVLTVFYNPGGYRCLEKDVTTGSIHELTDLSRQLLTFA